MQKLFFKITTLAFGALLLLGHCPQAEARAHVPCGAHIVTEMDATCLVTLEDGSQWKVSSWDADELYSWYEQGNHIPIEINPNYLSMNYSYYLTHQLSGSYVRANLVNAPVRGSPYAVTITGLDQTPYRKSGVYLSNGTFWKVSSLDSEEVLRWYVDDLVIIGKNTEWFSFDSHILINIHTNTFVRAQRF